MGFRDIPEALTEIWSMDELQSTGLDCLRSQDVTRLLKISHTTKIDTLEQAFKALGKNIAVSIC